MDDFAQNRSHGTALAAVGLLASIAHDVVLATARETHRAVADRTHRAVRRGVGPLGRPVEIVQTGVTAGVYGAVGLGLRAAGAGLDRLARAGVGPQLEAGRSGRLVGSAVNGVLGDELARTGSPLTYAAAVRRDSHDVALTELAVNAAFPAATGRIVVFVPGLCEDESHWERDRERRGGTYAESLSDLGWTPVHVRLNTGLSVRDNGSHLAELIDQLLAVWPVAVERIAMVGHSQGGLVARAATAVDGHFWPALLTDVVTLGTPHLGSPVAKAASGGSRLLRLTPESAAFSTFLLERRSIGIRDLAQGLAFETPPQEHVRYRVVAATVSRSTTHPFGALVGDLLVRPGSATGRDARGREVFPEADRLVVGASSHQALLNHPEVESALIRWLT